jgi:hypothetical protein
VWAPHVSGSDALVYCEFVRLEAFRGRAGPLLLASCRQLGWSKWRNIDPQMR